MVSASKVSVVSASKVGRPDQDNKVMIEKMRYAFKSLMPLLALAMAIKAKQDIFNASVESVLTP